MARKKRQPVKNKTVLTIQGDTVDLIDYWTRKKGFRSKAAFVEAAVKRYIAIENQDYDLPLAEIQRINHLTTAITALTEEEKRTRQTVNQGFNAILNLDEEDY